MSVCVLGTRLSNPLKNIGNLCCGVCSKRDHSILNNCGSRLQCSLLPIGRCHVTLFAVKNPAPCLWCGLLSKFHDHLFILWRVNRAHDGNIYCISWLVLVGGEALISWRLYCHPGFSHRPRSTTVRYRPKSRYSRVAGHLSADKPSGWPGLHDARVCFCHCHVPACLVQRFTAAASCLFLSVDVHSVHYTLLFRVRCSHYLRTCQLRILCRPNSLSYLY